ncbi:carboxypeptidase regulatory-like domain-containing protein [Methanobrevibacter boviskoreani]|uniref:carboxypeptidase regulatory-like domain-containing protein n=1 Tax=Methanobrevibacter boviskoreani TaxID=1348249 RepID=UPI000593D342|nr:carboxypeptidase regulatory-like domain-containing protein [Methanobrevibacter boviskoreani]
MKKYSKYLVLALLLITIVTITGVSAEDTSNYSSSDNTTLNSVNNNVNILTDDNVSDGNVTPVENTSIGENTTPVVENKTVNTNIDISVDNSSVYEPSIVNISVIGDDNATVNGGNISVIIKYDDNGTVYNKTLPVTDGKAIIQWTPTITGKYTINVDFNGYTADNITYSTSKGSKTYNAIANNNLIIISNNVVMYYRDGTKYYVFVTDIDGNPISNVSVEINIAGKSYKRITNENGTASLSLNLSPKTYNVTTSVVNSTVTNSSSVTINNWNNSLIKVNPVKLTKEYKLSNKFKVYISHNGTALQNVPVYIVIKGKTYKATTDNSGLAQLNINLKPGKYNVYAYVVNGNKKIGSYSTITVNKWNKKYAKLTVNKVVKNYADSNKIRVKLTYKNHGISGEKVLIKVAGKTYTRTTNSNGDVSMSFNKIGTYKVSASTNVVGVKVSGSNTVKVNPAYVNLLVNNNVNSYTGQSDNKGKLALFYNINKKYLDSKNKTVNNKLKLQFTYNNKPRVQQYVSVTINGKNTVYKTDKNGRIYADISKAKTGCQYVTVIYYSFDKNYYSLKWSVRVNFR